MGNLIQDMAGMNPSYFSEYFKKNLGINFSDYIAKLRINEAIRMLQENKLSITEIAYNCGFNNSSSFYNTFKKITGTNPGKYIK
jgi:two-component system response regulator YesN